MKNAKTEDDKIKYMMLQEVYIDTAYNLDSTSANVLIAKGWIHRAKTREYNRLGEYDKIKGELDEAFISYKKAKEINLLMKFETLKNYVKLLTKKFLIKLKTILLIFLYLPASCGTSPPILLTALTQIPVNRK